jgi:hypothetical protein
MFFLLEKGGGGKQEGRDYKKEFPISWRSRVHAWLSNSESKLKSTDRRRFYF